MYSISAKKVYDVWSTEVECLQIIDLRDEDLHNEQHIPGSQWCSVELIEREVECSGTDQLLAIVADDLNIRDFSRYDHVAVLVGGVQSWKNMGYPLTTSVRAAQQGGKEWVK